MSYHIKPVNLYVGGAGLATFNPLRFPIKVGTFLLPSLFYKNVTNLPEYLLLIVTRRGIEPLYRELPNLQTCHRNRTDLVSNLVKY